MKQCIRITPEDNMATLLIDLQIGDLLTLETGEALQAREDIPYGHKIALKLIPKGTAIIKYIGFRCALCKWQTLRRRDFVNGRYFNLPHRIYCLSVAWADILVNYTIKNVGKKGETQ